MVGSLFIAAAGVFAIGVAVAIVVLVTIGIRREERGFREERRFLEEHGIWGTPDAPDHYLLEQAPNGLSSVSRSLTGLRVRHVPIRARSNDRQGLPG